jgi:glycosyltransferase involved in cell wall biosynthesis
LAPSRPLQIPSVTRSSDRKGLVYVGQVTERKGLWQLLQAFNKIKGYDLDIIGASRNDTDFKQKLEKWVESHNLSAQVHFRGQVDDPTEFYAKSLIHIAPSIYDEPLGMVVLEAKKVGTPSIVFPSGGLPEMVRHGIDGYICRDKTPEALVEAIEWMLSDRDRLIRMGEAARDDYESRFGRERFLQEWAKIYLTALQST